MLLMFADFLEHQILPAFILKFNPDHIHSLVNVYNNEVSEIQSKECSFNNSSEIFQYLFHENISLQSRYEALSL
jgi:hypothetical protein